MVATYEILGRTVGSHQIALATIGVTLLVAIPNPFAKAVKQEPKIDASSPEEKKFILDYLKKAEAADAKVTGAKAAPQH